MADTPNTEQAELESGYSDTPTETPAPTPEPTQAPVEPVAAPDPMKEVLERLDKFETTTSKLAGHIGGLTRTQQEIQQTLAASKVAAKGADDAPTQAQVHDAVGNPKEWETLKEDYPNWAAGMEKLLDHRLAAQKTPLASEDIDKAVDKQMQARIAAQSKERADEISEMHPGWEKDLWATGTDGAAARTPDYEAWTKTMTPELVAKFENSNSVIYVDRKLTEFYAWKKAKSAQASTSEPTQPPRNVSTRQKRLEAAVTPRGTGGHASGGSTELDEMEAGYSG